VEGLNSSLALAAGDLWPKNFEPIYWLARSLKAGVGNLRHACHTWPAKQISNGTQMLHVIPINFVKTLTLTCMKLRMLLTHWMLQNLISRHTVSKRLPIPGLNFQSKKLLYLRSSKYSSREVEFYFTNNEREIM